MNASQLRNFSDAELLRHLEDARHHSPVIGELCKRLEEKEPEPLDESVEGPICLAAMVLDLDYANGIANLKVSK